MTPAIAPLSDLFPTPGPVGSCGARTCHGMDILAAHATMVDRIAEMLLCGNDSRAILDALVLMTGEGFAVDRSLIYRIDFAGERIFALAEYLSPGIVPTTDSYPLAVFASSARYFFETHSWLESHAAAPHPLLVQEGSAKLLHGERKIQSLLWYPFAFDESGFSLLVFNQVTEPRAWGELIELVATVSRLVGIALMKLDLLARSRAADEALAAVS